MLKKLSPKQLVGGVVAFFTALVLIRAVFQVLGDDVDAFVNGLIVFVYVLLGLFLIIALVFAIISIVENPKSLLRIGIGAAVVGVIFLVSYSGEASSSDEALANAVTTTTLALIVITIAVLAVMEIKKIFSNA